MNRKALIAAAKRARRARLAVESDPTFRKVIAAFVKAKLLHTNYDPGVAPERVTVSEVLRAGEHEPRLLELLPAILLKRLRFVQVDHIPADLDEVLRALRKGQVPPTFRGMPGKDLEKWLSRVGHQGKAPSVTKTFRFKAEEAALLHTLSQQRGRSEIDVLREGLRAVAQRVAKSEA